MTLGDVADAVTKEEAGRMTVEVFFAERLDFYLRDAKGQAYDVVKAVLAVGANDVRDAVVRAEAVTAVRGSDDFVAVSAAFKADEEYSGAGGRRRVSCLRRRRSRAVRLHPAEVVTLNTEAGVVREKVKKLADRREYLSALEAIATLRPHVDDFFDQVMIMDPDQNVRSRRLLMLQRIVRTFSGIADFSEIVTAG